MKSLESNVDGVSKNFVAENLAALRALFPEIVTERGDGAAIDVDALRALVGDRTVDSSDEKFGLSWHGKRRAGRLALSVSAGTLRPDPQTSVNWDTTENLLIEGDNLEVLKLLQKSYSGNVKLIFIDPPYNTGRDFVYPDDFQDSVRNYLELTGQIEAGQKIVSNTDAGGRFHTQWLNMMYPRLKLAHSLLRADGLLFATIDDSEVHHLREVLEQIFGAENFIANVIWEKKYTRANDAQFFSDNHDHVLVFAKNRERASLAGQARTASQLAAYTNPDSHAKGPWKATPLHAKSGSNTAAYTFRNGVTWSPPVGTFRRYSDETMAAMDLGGQIWFGADGKATPSRKSFLSDVKSGVTPVTIWPHGEVGHNHEANSELKELLGQGVFDTPKPTRLVRRILELATIANEGEIVMDFFAGSGTTGHAVQAQNAADGGDRRFILVQLPEPLDPGNPHQKAAVELCDRLSLARNIAELTKERLRKSAKKIRKEAPLFVGDLGFRVFRLDTSNIRLWEPNHDNIPQSLLDHQLHLREDRTDEDVLFELLLKRGLDLCVPVEKRSVASKDVYCVGGGVLFACLAAEIVGEGVEAIALGIVNWLTESSPVGDTTCVFRDSAFADDVAKSNIAAILNQHGIKNVQSL